MIILGIDPGTARIGYSILKKEDGEAKLVDYGCLELRDREQKTRLAEISRFMGGIIAEHRPGILSIEKLFFTKNAKTAFSVSEARGVIINSANLAGLEIVEFTPPEVKIAATGYGKADKKQVQKMVCRMLNLEKIPEPDDASDAIAIALAACYTNPKLKN